MDYLLPGWTVLTRVVLRANFTKVKSAFLIDF